MIKENVYYHSSIPPPAIQSKILKKLLLTSTTKVPFYDPSSNIYIYIYIIYTNWLYFNGVAEFYMSHIKKKKIFKMTITKLKIYFYYVDNIFIATHSYNEINKLKQF